MVDDVTEDEGSSAEASPQDQFVLLYVTYEARVRAYAARRVPPGVEIDDVVADAFATAWRHLATLPTDPVGWLLRTTANAVLNASRAGRRRDRLLSRIKFERATPTRPTVPDDPQLDQALINLTARDREVLALAYWDDLTPAQSAEVLGISEGAFRVRLHRAKKRLKGLLLTDERAHAALRPAPLTTCKEPRHE